MNALLDAVGGELALSGKCGCFSVVRSDDAVGLVKRPIVRPNVANNRPAEGRAG